jgi:hypothetical protein
MYVVRTRFICFSDIRRTAVEAFVPPEHVNQYTPAPRIMCRKVKCNSCDKYTWAGCGMHIQSALAGVVEDERCPNWKKGASSPCGPPNEKYSSNVFSTFTGFFGGSK